MLRYTVEIDLPDLPKNGGLAPLDTAAHSHHEWCVHSRGCHSLMSDTAGETDDEPELDRRIRDLDTVFSEVTP